MRYNEYIIMPNHSHVIITNIGKTPVGADLRVCPNGLRLWIIPAAAASEPVSGMGIMRVNDHA